jgi:hypothetical protein
MGGLRHGAMLRGIWAFGARLANSGEARKPARKPEHRRRSRDHAVGAFYRTGWIPKALAV